MNLKNVFTDKVTTMSAYDVTNRSGMIKLDSMEVPYHLPEDMRKALGNMLALSNINRYPNPSSTSLVAKIKSTFELPKSCGVILGNGSDELIQIILTATMRPNAVVMSPVPSFVMYQQTAEILGMKFVGVDLESDFSLDEEKFISEIKTHKPAVIFLSCPNNPTGQNYSKEFVKKILSTSPGLVIIDEAYSAYSDSSSIDLLDQYDNAVMIRTVSKIGMAGIRLGYLVANPYLVEQFNKVRMPYNINVLTQASARFMLDQMAYVNKNINKILDQKLGLYEWFKSRDDVSVYQTQANFLLVRFEDGTKVFDKLVNEHKILVKNLHSYHPILENILRVTIGRRKENEKLKAALALILDK